MSTASKHHAPIKQFETGAVRGTDHAKCRLDLIPLEALEGFGAAFAEGIEKYGIDNWLKGFPQREVINHAIIHLYKYLNGDTFEDHLGHAMWNVGVASYQAKRRPDMCKLSPYQETRTDLDADMIQKMTRKMINDDIASFTGQCSLKDGTGLVQDPHWEAFPVHSDANGAGDVIGWRVRWSERFKTGWLLAAHYIGGEEGGPSLEWCEIAAKRTAEDWNKKRIGPWEKSGGEILEKAEEARDVKAASTEAKVRDRAGQPEA
jgi:hypothetical protein